MFPHAAMSAPVLSLLLSLRHVVLLSAAAAPPADHRGLIGCVTAAEPSLLRLHGPVDARDLDPVHCSTRCLDEGFQVAALTFESCYCGNGQHDGVLLSDCLNMSSPGDTHRPGSLSAAHGTVVLYRPSAEELHKNMTGRMKLPSVQIHAEQPAYPTNTAVTFTALNDATEPVEFMWHFGDSGPRSRSWSSSGLTSRRYSRPGRYNVYVVMSTSQVWVTSELLPLVVQRAVRLSRLVHQASVLPNHTLTLSCRVNAGTDLLFLWDFGDGSSRWGQSTEEHVFHGTGEFRVEVIVSNQVSSASLSSHIFVVQRPCQPPPVKNMGPLTVQVRRHEVTHLGVTFETELDCDTSSGLQYTWTLLDSGGRSLSLPGTDTHTQALTLRSHLLQYDTYRATARVQVSDSVVYSNYTVTVHVMPAPPVAFILGGTNIFINSRNSATLTLDGRRSYDPDFPENTLSYTWTCKPLSSIITSCFSRHVSSSSSSVLAVPAAALKPEFDQFQFSLTVHSGQRSASTHTFITVKPHVKGKLSVSCPRCHGDQVNSDQWFSVHAWCEDCDVPLAHLHFTWSLVLVNASSRPVTEVPFCSSVDLGAPSSITDEWTSTLSPPDISSDGFFVQHSRNMNLGLTDETGSGGEELFYDSSITDSPSLVHEKSTDQYSDVIGEFPPDSDSSTDWDFPFSVEESGDGQESDYDLHFPNPEEGDSGSSAGRPTDVEDETISSEEDAIFDPDTGEGSDLVVSGPSVLKQEPTLLDLPRDPVHTHLFHSYTYTGISSSVIKFRAFSLRPGSRYMLDVTAKSRDVLFGRTQLFFKTSPAPQGVKCQVQPLRGAELHTQFSVFCVSGKEDLLYEYSFSIGDRPPRVLYKGRDFQYYFSLPAGDATDDYKVTIYTEIRSSRYGTVTEPCPVTVHVQPTFLRDTLPHHHHHHHPDEELSVTGLRSLWALQQLGNSVEVRNHVSLLSVVLNRLSLDSDTHALRHTRNVLICTVCELESRDQETMVDSLFLLKDLLHVTHQVSLPSVRRVTRYISDLFPESARPIGPDQENVHTLVSLLSHLLQAAHSHQDLIPQTPDATKVSESHDSRSDSALPGGCRAESSGGDGSVSAKQRNGLIDEVLFSAADLMLRYISLQQQQQQQHTISSGLLSLHAANQTSALVRGGSALFHMPPSLMQLLLIGHTGAAAAAAAEPRLQQQQQQHQPCVLSVVTELTSNPYTCSRPPTQLSGAVVDLSLFRCSSRKRIPVRSLVQPINIHLKHPPIQISWVDEYVLSPGHIHYHSFNISQQHLQQVVQLRAMFTLPIGKLFPIMLLFRMLERPTPSMHHLHTIQRWEKNSVHITLPPSYLNSAGVAHLALLDADFAKQRRHRQMGEQVRYRVSVVSSQCLTWDGHQGAWTHQGCVTQQEDTTMDVNCSCVHLRPLTVLQRHILTKHDSADLDQFLSVSHDATVLSVLLAVCVCVFVPALLVCKRADASAGSGRIHFLSDNSPSDPHLYAVTVHTGLCSAAGMSAKVYMELRGEDGFSHTKELKVPGCTLFRRNSRDTFILSCADSLGSVWAVHIWHDASGPSPDWFLRHVEVSEVTSGAVSGRSWLFVAQCWLAASRGDGQVERMLRVCSHGLGFAQMLCFKLTDFLADFHIWASVYSRPRPHWFTHTQRLGVCALLFLGYACACVVIISQMDEQLPLDPGVLHISTVAVTTGALSVAAVLPVATAVSLLFRLHKVKLPRSGVQDAKGRKAEDSEDALSPNRSVFHLSLSRLEPWIQETWRRKHQDTDLIPVSNTTQGKNKPVDVMVSRGEEEISVCGTEKEVLDQEAAGGSRRHGGGRRGPPWCCSVAWALCLLLSLSCLLLSALLGMRFSSSKVLLWVHSLFFSLVSCIFFIQPAAIFLMAVLVSCSHSNKKDFHPFSTITDFEIQLYSGYVDACSFDKMLAERQRARYLRLVRPPSPTELRRSSGRKRRETLINNTLRDLCVCVSMFVLMLCVAHGSSSTDHYRLNTAVSEQIIRNPGYNSDFMSIKKPDQWWRWTQNTLLDFLYKNSSSTSEQSHILIGQPILWKTEGTGSSQEQVQEPEHLQSAHPNSNTPVSMATPLTTCGRLGCYTGPSSTVGLGLTKSEAAAALSLLRSGSWLGRWTVQLKVQFTLFSPAPNLFTSVTLLTEQTPTSVLVPSLKVRSVRLFHSPAVWDYFVMVCQLVFLLFSLSQLCLQVCTVRQQGLMGYWRTPHTWLELSLLTVTVVYYIYHLCRSSALMEMVELLQRHRGHADVSALASWEQDLRSLRGFLLFLLTLKCLTVLRLNATFSSSAALLTHFLRSLLWPTVTGLILVVALSCAGSLLFGHSSWVFSSVPRSLQRVLYWGAHSLCSSVLWTALVLGLVTSLIRKAKKSQSGRRDVFTLRELTSYIKQRIWEFIGQREPKWTDDRVESKTYHLEEFEGLVDELLFRLDALSDCLHHSLPPKLHLCSREQSPVSLPVQEPSLTQEFDQEETTEEMIRSKLEPEMLHFLQQRGQMRHDVTSLDFDHVQQTGENEGNPQETELQANCHSLSLIRMWTGDDAQEQTSDSCWSSKTQAAHTEVVVEVLVHEEPGGPEPEEQDMTR